jgi:NAD(P)-dependent dehydrogenase (short-subunit alcohol dehydrogenase family)
VNSVCPLLGGTGLYAFPFPTTIEVSYSHPLRFKHFLEVDDTPENRSKFLSNVPLGRLCEAGDVANACLFFATDESEYVTGIIMEVDGGRAI